MEVSAGNRIVVESERVGQSPREGTVEEVMSGSPLRVRVRWDDGSVSIFAPNAGAARVQPSQQQPARGRSR
jgi:hypothetical protein